MHATISLDGKQAANDKHRILFKDPDKSAFAEVMGGMSYSKGYYDSAAYFTEQAAKVMGIPELAQKFSSRWQNLHLDADDYNVIVADWVEAATAEKEKKAEDRGYNRGLKDGRKAGSAISKAAVRDGQGADTAPKGGGGRSAADEAALLLNPDTPISVIKEIRDRQKAAQ